MPPIDDDDREFDAEAAALAGTTPAAPEVDDDPPGTEAAAPEQEAAPAGDPDPDEELARKMGWSPKDGWRGPADQWVDAKEFLSRANPRMWQERFEKVEKDNQRTIERLERMNADALKRQQEQHRAEVENLRARRDRDVINVAAQHGAEAAEQRRQEWDTHIGQKETEAPAAPRVQPTGRPPEAEAWIAKRQAYSTDPVFAVAAERELDRIHVQLKDRPLSEHFEELDRRLAATGRFNDIYQAPASKPTATAAPPADSRQMDGVRVSGKKATNYASRLNAAERRQGERFVKTGLYKDIESYAKALNDE